MSKVTRLLRDDLGYEPRQPGSRILTVKYYTILPLNSLIFFINVTINVRRRNICQARMDIHYVLYSISTFDVLIQKPNKPASTLVISYLNSSFTQLTKWENANIVQYFSLLMSQSVNFCLRITFWIWDSLDSHVMSMTVTKVPNLVPSVQFLVPLFHPLLSHQHSPSKIKSDRIS